MFSIIVAVDEKGAIGKNNTIPWRLPSDMKHFKRYTLDKTVLMGYKTALSIGRALPKRKNLVLSQNHDAPYDGQIHLSTVAMVLKYRDMECAFDTSVEIVVCGGAGVYRSFLPYAERLIVSHVPLVVPDADVFIPELRKEALSQNEDWKLKSSETILNDGDDCQFEIATYERVRNLKPYFSDNADDRHITKHPVMSRHTDQLSFFTPQQFTLL